MSSGNVVRRAALQTAVGHFHKVEGLRLFIRSSAWTNLISIENGARSRGVARAECNVFPNDAPGILGRQYDVLIRGFMVRASTPANIQKVPEAEQLLEE